jgi:hypothetical protein
MKEILIILIDSLNIVFWLFNPKERQLDRLYERVKKKINIYPFFLFLSLYHIRNGKVIGIPVNGKDTVLG